MIVAVLNTKGGVGKTTAALNLAVGRALQGRDVLAVDGDRQGSLIAALGNRDGVSALATAHYSDGQVLRQQVTLAKSRYQDIIIDAGGRDNTALRAAMLLADLVLIPFQPRSFDIWALDDMAGLLAEMRALQDVHALAFLAMADARGRDNDEAAESIPEGIQYLDSPVGRRKAIADAAALGRSVLEDGKDEKAVFEVQRLITSVFR